MSCLGAWLVIAVERVWQCSFRFWLNKLTRTFATQVEA
jgi:hypothetical protein